MTSDLPPDVAANRPRFSAPWRDLPGDDHARIDERAELHGQLLREVGPGHPLHGVDLTVVGRSDAADDIAVHCADGRWAIVHLTWTTTASQPPWPRTAFFPDARALGQALDPDACAESP
jgi:hypothetical protein